MRVKIAKDGSIRHRWYRQLDGSNIIGPKVLDLVLPIEYGK